MSPVRCAFVIVFCASAFVLHTDAHVNAAPPGTVINIYTAGSNKKRDVVAFSVGSTIDNKAKKTSRVKMNHVFYNDGKYFNLATSVFTAPVHGLYAFYFGAASVMNSRTHTFLYVGKTPTTEKAVACTYDYSSQHGQASGSVLYVLEKGDVASMWVQGGWSVDGYPLPSIHFNGYLLQSFE